MWLNSAGFPEEVTCNCMGVHALKSGSSHTPFPPPCVLQATDVRSAVQLTLKSFFAYQQRKQPEDPFPLLVVDEANFMQDWQSDSERKGILAFFVKVSVCRGGQGLVCAMFESPLRS